MEPIRIKKTPKTSFNKDRRPSKLLLDQIAHLEWAALPAWQRKPQLLKRYEKRRVKTEQQAAERIAQLTEMVMQANEKGAHVAPTGTRPRVVLPPLPGAARARTKASTAARTPKAKKAKKAKKVAKAGKKVTKARTARTAKKKTARRRP